MYAATTDCARVAGRRIERPRRSLVLIVAKGLAAISGFVKRGVTRGEFRDSAVSDLPHLVLAPVMLSIIWGIIFKDRRLDTDTLIETQIDMILTHIKV